MNFSLDFVVGLALGIGTPLALAWLYLRASIAVEDEHAALVAHFGQLRATLTRPGLHFYPARILPWTSVRHVSLQRDFRHIINVPVNDARGTTLLVDLWVEFRIIDAEKSVFGVEDWDRALQNLVSHAATSILGNREFSAILSDRTELGQRLGEEIADDTARWGVKVEFVFVQNVSLLPEVSRVVFETVAARLRRAKAAIDESGRIRVAKLEAQTHAQLASLVADAKGQYPAAIGAALARLQSKPKVFDAYNTLYEYSTLRPHRMTAFRGFGADEMRAVDASMVAVDAAGDAASRASSTMSTRVR